MRVSSELSGFSEPAELKTLLTKLRTIYDLRQMLTFHGELGNYRRLEEKQVGGELLKSKLKSKLGGETYLKQFPGSIETNILLPGWSELHAICEMKGSRKTESAFAFASLSTLVESLLTFSKPHKTVPHPLH